MTKRAAHRKSPRRATEIQGAITLTENTLVEEIPVRSIVQHENDVAAALFPKVGDYLQLLAEAYTLSGLIFEKAYPERNVSLAKQVCTKLLMRINNDLRAVMMLAEVGYDVQANALAASIYEGAFTLGTIYDDSALAKQWVEHSDPKVSFKNAYDLAKAALANYGAHADWTDSFYQIYRQLCWGKHLNPISEQQGGIERIGDVIDYIPGPRADELTERGISYCCVFTVLFGIIGMEMFVRRHVKAENQQELLISLKDLGERRETLYQKGLARWASADPFPGKW